MCPDVFGKLYLLSDSKQPLSVCLFRTTCLIANIILPGTSDRSDVQTSSGIIWQHRVFVKMPIVLPFGNGLIL